MSVDKRVEDGVNEEHDGYEESAYQVARRLYGRSLEPRNRRELERSLAAWRELGSADRTFVLAHLGMLRLRALEEVAVGVDAADRDHAHERDVSEPVPDDDETEEVELPAYDVGALSQM